ncbi:MAG TPA: HNH endonuclease [Clostridiales bacterium]|nr:HNH endonuclease [Clostridiales bacterium]
MGFSKNTTERNIVIYNEFIIINKLSHCSVVEFNTLYGVKKIAIILNACNRIIYVLDYQYNHDALNILEEYNIIFSTLKADKTFYLKGEYELNIREYIINFPYSIKYNILKNTLHINKINNVAGSLKIILNTTNRQYRMGAFKHKKIGTGKDACVFYEIDNVQTELANLASKITNEKQRKYRESHQYRKSYDMIQEYDEGKENKLESNENKAKRKYTRKNSKVITYKINNEVFDYEKTNNIIRKDISHELEAVSSDKIIINSSESYTVNNYNHNPKNNKTNTNKEINNDLLINKGNLEPEKKLRTFIATNRNLTIVKYLKNLYENKCQICAESIEISNNQFLCEVHHIIPLGIHNGADVLENMIVLCPNHHAMFDRGAITIDLDKKIVIHFNKSDPLNNKPIELKHEINKSYIDYHNKNIFINYTHYQQYENNDINSKNIIVDYGDIVTLQDTNTKEVFNVKIEDKFNREFMKDIEKILLHKALFEYINYGGFVYQITEILK